MSGVSDRPLISFVFSFRNEEGNIDTLIDRVRAAARAADVDHEMIFIDDDSSDRSPEILRDYAASDPKVKIITMSRPFGVSPCAMAGMERACGDAVIYMDADLQDPPELCPKMIDEWRNGADVVNMTRTRRLGESAFKMWVTHQAYRVIKMISDTDIPMDTGDFKLLSRRVVDEVVKLREYDPFLRGLVRWVGFRQVMLTYERQPRETGVTHWPLMGSGPIRTFIAGVTSFSQVPLYIGLLLGAIVSIFSFCYLIFIIITTLVFKMNLPGWPAMMVSILALGGIILLTQGIQGIYIGRIHAELKRRPNYIVSDLTNFDEIPSELKKKSTLSKTP